ncbi:MAG: hypothetical protein K8T20_08270 [Planctomycetes bacterium]|nr:hypothetical protein [Planctomycetota bacterium]
MRLMRELLAAEAVMFAPAGGGGVKKGEDVAAAGKAAEAAAIAAAKAAAARGDAGFRVAVANAAGQQINIQLPGGKPAQNNIGIPNQGTGQSWSGLPTGVQDTMLAMQQGPPMIGTIPVLGTQPADESDVFQETDHRLFKDPEDWVPGSSMWPPGWHWDPEKTGKDGKKGGIVVDAGSSESYPAPPIGPGYDSTPPPSAGDLPAPRGIGEIPDTFECPKEFLIRAVTAASLPRYDVGTAKSLLSIRERLRRSMAGDFTQFKNVLQAHSQDDSSTIKAAVRDYLEKLVQKQPKFCTRGNCQSRNCFTNERHLISFEPTGRPDSNDPSQLRPGASLTFPPPGISTVPKLLYTSYYFYYTVLCSCI